MGNEVVELKMVVGGAGAGSGEEYITGRRVGSGENGVDIAHGC